MPTDEVGKLYPIAKAILTPLFRAGWKFDLQGLENIPATGGAILCPNHTSVLDSFFVPALLPRRVSYVGKAEYMDDWKTKFLFPAMGMIPIDRSGGDKSTAALDAAEAILQRGELFGIFPEGTRSRDGVLHKGHTGAARLAFKVDCPIFPVGVVGTREIQPPDAKLPKVGGACSLRIGEPIYPTRYRNRAEDHIALRQMIDEVMYEIRELTGQEYRNTYATKKAETLPSGAAVVPKLLSA